MDENLSKSDLTLFRKVLLRVVGTVMILISLFLIISMKTLNLSETGWNTLSSEPSTNFFGVFGANVSGFLLKEFGLLSIGFIIIMLLLYGIKHLKYQTITNPIIRFLMLFFLIFLFGLLSQPLQNFLKNYFSLDILLFDYEGFSSRIYKVMAIKFNNNFNFLESENDYIFNLTLVFLCLAIFYYVSLIKIKDFYFLKPLFLPFLWALQLVYNLMIRKNYIENTYDNLVGENERNPYTKFKSYFSFKKRSNNKPLKKDQVAVNLSEIENNYLSENKVNNLNKNKFNNVQQKLPLSSQNGFILPPINLLENQKNSSSLPDNQVLNSNARLLESVLKDYSINGEIESVRHGPVVTRYDLKPAPGLRSQRVISLAEDIARSMLAESVRVAMVPGKNVIGIELPNKNRDTVVLRNILESENFQNANFKLPLCLGKDIAGNSVIVDLANMPHLLIAGTTGSGKSVGVNSMIISLLYKHTPETCRFIMIDPKMLELSVYDGIPHLLTPVVTDPNKAITSLKWTVREMENRYSLMSKLGVRNIENYNQRILKAQKKGEVLSQNIQIGFDTETGQPIFEEQEINLTQLPLIVVVIDEVADLMLVAGKEIEASVQRLAQMARAAGIHVIMATQRPSVDVITGTIKANFPTRISFQVTSKIDSRTILGEQGAEQLLGKGDMLFMAGGGKVVRVHGPFLNDSEVEKVTSYLSKQSSPEYDDTITEEQDHDNLNINNTKSTKDELYEEAVKMVIREQKASTSFIQRYFRIGYNRAATIIEQMEENNIVSRPGRAGKREILLEK